jgi:hypothetical protein
MGIRQNTRILSGATIALRLEGTPEFNQDLVDEVFEALGPDIVNRVNMIHLILVDRNEFERVHSILDRVNGPNKNLVGKPSYSEVANRQEREIAERRRAQPEIERALEA